VRRSLPFVLVGLAILVGLASMSLPQVALAHGSVEANRASVSNDAHLAAYYEYGTTQVHPKVCVHVILQARPGDGGSWTELRNSRQCDRNLSGMWGHLCNAAAWVTRAKARAANFPAPPPRRLGVHALR
jgi:hypothetical protein